jgi:hypothetical protein
MTSWFPLSCFFPPFFRAGRCFSVLGGCRGLGQSRFSCLAFPLGGGGGVLGMGASLPLSRALTSSRFATGVWSQSGVCHRLAGSRLDVGPALATVRVDRQRGGIVLLLRNAVVSWVREILSVWFQSGSCHREAGSGLAVGSARLTLRVDRQKGGDVLRLGEVDLS